MIAPLPPGPFDNPQRHQRMTAYYNEHDPYAAQWLRNLIAAGHIAPGVVDERSIEDVNPTELAGYTQCHWFAGVGVWSAALRAEGWPDDRPVWTGSEPCQPFSAAGKRGGAADERYLRPAWQHLIAVCRPVEILGEQVASKDGLTWLDTIHADLEGEGYAVGAVDSCSAGFGAPHIRQRIHWGAKRLEHVAGDGRLEWRPEPGGRGVARGCGAGGVENAELPAGARQRPVGGKSVRGQEAVRPAGGGMAGGLDHPGTDAGVFHREVASRLADADSERFARVGLLLQPRRPQQAGVEVGRHGEPDRPGPVNGFWRDADWLLCRDDKWRPVRPGTFPLAHGATARVGRLRAYGNAVNIEQTKAFIRAWIEVTT